MVVSSIPVDSAVVQAAIAVVIGLVGSYRYYRKTGSVPLAKLPLRAFRRLLYTLRVQFATKGKPPETKTIDESIAKVRDELAKHSYEPKWFFSYHYRGEDENLRRYFYDPSKKYPHRQMHVRLWDNGDMTTDEYSHEEPSALHHPIAHIRTKYLSSATSWLAEAYADAGGRAMTLNPIKFGDE